MSDEWSIKVTGCDATLFAVLYRNGGNNPWASVLLTGWSAGPRMWFRSVERRTAKATKILMAKAAVIEDRERRAGQLRWRAQVEARRQGMRRG